MGNCFGKPSSKSFQGEGRTVGSSPTDNASAPTPAARKQAAPPSQGRTLGSSNAQQGTAPTPKEAAARAAESRAAASQTTTSNNAPKGKLGKQLDAQRAQTQSDTLQQNARENLAAREADSAARMREYN